MQRVPAPKDTRSERLRALIFDSYYDPYKACTAEVEDAAAAAYAGALCTQEAAMQAQLILYATSSVSSWSCSQPARWAAHWQRKSIQSYAG